MQASYLLNGFNDNKLYPIKQKKKIKTYFDHATYCKIDDTTGQSKLHSETGAGRVSRYIILSHQAGIRFFSPESYPDRIYGSYAIVMFLMQNASHFNQETIC
jgi:hypothetical protein